MIYCDFKKGSRVELAPTEEVDGTTERAYYFFVPISEILRYKK